MADTRWPGHWFRLEAKLPAEREDDAIGLVDLEDCLGSATQPAGPRAVVLRSWFAGADQAQRAGSRLREGLGLGPDAIVFGEEADTGWLDASLQPRPPIEVGRFVVVESADEAAAVPDRVAIVIPRGRAFGTGEHATTRLCLELIERHLHPGVAGADVGTGSGVLACALALGGAGDVLAVDNDPAVLDVAAANVEVNGVAGRVRVGEGSWAAMPADGSLALVAANIHRSGVVRGAGAVARALAPGGVAVLSGFLGRDAETVIAAWKGHGFTVEATRTEGEWAALALRRVSG